MVDTSKDSVQDDVTNPPAEGASTVPMTEYQKLQRQLEKSRTANREGSRREREAELARVELDTLSKAFVSLSSAVESGDTEDVAEIGTKYKAAQTTLTTQGVYRGEIEDSLAGADMDWDDETLEEARTAWDAGDFEKSVRLVETTTRTATPVDNSVLQEAVRKELVSLGLKVDDGAGTSTPRKAPSDMELIEDLGGMSLDEIYDNR